MRSGDEIGRAEKRAFLGRLRHEHVQRRTGHMAIVERLLQGRFVNQAATRAVDDADALLGLGEILPAQNVARLLSKRRVQRDERSEEHTSELQSLLRISYAVFCLKKTKN